MASLLDRLADVVAPTLAAIDQVKVRIGPAGLQIGALLAAPVAFVIAIRITYAIFKRIGLMRIYLLALGLFELIPLQKYLLEDKPLSGFATGLTDAPAERQLWCFMLVLLMLSRLLAFAAPRSTPVLFHLASVHVAEVVYMYAQQKAT